ncbi:hypothetical protein KXD93_28375 [Mucilaginibacter sp. BJC16-A38]|uniref:hypothetical protein n=1 Tax=Mucilaginibacter phenanthrenivorans TaxID=1234842 RepID=UPI00215831FE|nr:hypothetical protein [Mucilaginibacter phenanthrenivorans]MCR8561604.1 hypothetical protein [Mucilaginibacter phenanthrenivorans]
MKRLFLLPVLLLFFFLRTNAQNSRWMYLSSDKDETLMIDTAKNDIKQFKTYEGHNNVVLIWIKGLKNKVDKEGSSIESSLMHIAIDTTTSELGSKSITLYRGDSVVQSQNYSIITWQDVLPGSNGEVFVEYCRALNRHDLMLKYILAAGLHDIEAPKKN